MKWKIKEKNLKKKRSDWAQREGSGKKECVWVVCVVCVGEGSCTRLVLAIIKEKKTTENYCKSKSCLFHFISYTIVIARSDTSVMWYIANFVGGVNGLVPLNL